MTPSCVPGANESRAYRAEQCFECKTAPPAQCAGGAVRDASAALLGRSSRTHKLPARNEAESVGKEEDRRAIHVGQYKVHSRKVKSPRSNSPGPSASVDAEWAGFASRMTQKLQISTEAMLLLRSSVAKPASSASGRKKASAHFRVSSGKARFRLEDSRLIPRSRQLAGLGREIRTSSPVAVPKMPCSSPSSNGGFAMHGSIMKSLSAAALAVCFIAGSASAQGKGHGNDKGHGNGRGDEKHGDEHPVVMDQHHDVVIDQRDVDPRHGDARRAIPRHVVVTTNDGDYRRVPPGLAKKGGVPPGLAKKGGLPPGQAKKYYRPIDGLPVVRDVFMHNGYTVVRTQPYGASQYVYYRQANGPIQRAVIVPGTTQLGFQNVPQALVAEILSRLY